MIAKICAMLKSISLSNLDIDVNHLNSCPFKWIFIYCFHFDKTFIANQNFHLKVKKTKNKKIEVLSYNFVVFK